MLRVNSTNKFNPAHLTNDKKLFDGVIKLSVLVQP